MLFLFWNVLNRDKPLVQAFFYANINTWQTRINLRNVYVNDLRVIMVNNPIHAIFYAFEDI